MPVHGEHAGAARVRRERKLRSFWRHEQMAIQMVLASVQHHSFGKVGTSHAALRGQKQGTRTVQGEEHELYHTAKFRTTPLPAGGLPAPLSEVAGKQVVLVRHVVEHMADVCPAVQTLDAPVPQLVDSVLEFFRRLDLPVAEQAIDVPMFSSSSSCPSRAVLSEPQLVEQLVEVPTVLSYSLLHRRTAEQIVDTPTLHGRGGGARGGLHGLSQGQGSSAVSGAVNVDSPVPGRGGGARGGFPGLSQGQGSTAVCGADEVVSPTLHARGGGARGGLQGLSQGQGSTAVWWNRHMSFLRFLTVVQVVLLEGFKALSQGQGSAAVFGADNVVSPASSRSWRRCSGRSSQASPRGQGSAAVYGAHHEDTPVPHGRGEGARGGLHSFSSGHQSGQRSAEQNVISAPSFRSRRARRTAEQNVDIPVRRSRAHGGLQDFSPGQSSSQRPVPGDEEDPPARFGTVLMASGDTPGVIRADDGQCLRFQLPSWFRIPVGARVAFDAEEGDGVGTAYNVHCWGD